MNEDIVRTAVDQAVIDAAKAVDFASAQIAGIVTNSEQWGEFWRAIQAMHEALDQLPKPHVHNWTVSRKYRTQLVLICNGHPEGQRPTFYVENKLPIEVPSKGIE